ncbi:MAG TPA: carboxypeptidase regulatory-like domain-containing protein [Polyangiaceae bacterium]|nr:carboxypeptidase regulatory-like domain-containing protein [Polyangiaceae bacterium]
MSRRVLDAITIACALCACFFLVLGLRDTPRVAVDLAGPPIPLPAAARTAVLRLLATTAAGPHPEQAMTHVFWEHGGAEYRVGSAPLRAGEATLRELPEGAVWVLVEAPGFARVARAVSLGPLETELSVTLVPEATLDVRVTDERGAPIAGATVLVSADDPLPFGTLTSVKGKATVSRLPAAPWTVNVTARGYESAERAGVKGPVTLSLRRLGSIDVRVTHRDGTPAPRASVSIAGSSLWPARRTVADDAGHCRIAGLLAGAYDLAATLGGDVSEPLIGYNLERGADVEVTLVLEPGRFVTAIVTDGDGDAPGLVPRADVVLTPGGVGSFPLLGRTGANGRVTLGPIGRGPATLGARADGFVSSALVAVPAGTNEPVTVPLLRGGTLTGDVVDARGFPVEGASIDVVGSDTFGLPVSDSPLTAAFRNTHFDWALTGPAPLVPAGELGVVPGPVPPIPPPGARLTPGADPWALAEVAAPVVEAWVTNRNGAFTARPVTPGRVHAVARHPDYVEGSSQSVTLGPGGEAHVKIVLHAGGSLTGRLLDDRSFPVENATIEAQSTRTALTRTAQTARDGSFELTGLPSEVTLLVRRPDGERRVALRRDLTIPESQRTNIDLVLPPLREAVHFKIVGGDDSPVELATVSVLSLDPAVVLHETLFTDSDGGAEIADARGLNLRIVVESPGFPRKTLSVDRAAELIRIALEQGVLVEGSVTAVRGRQAVTGALVTLVSDGTRRTTRTDAEGRYRFADIAAGVVHVGVNHPDFASESFEATVSRGSRADRPFELAPVDLSEPGSAEGEVVDADGNAVAGARVSVGAAPSYLPTGALPPGMTQTDARGHFKLERIAEGKQTLEAVSAVAGRGRASVEVRAGRVEGGVRIVLKAENVEESLGAGNVAVTLGERGSGSDLEIVVVEVAAASEAERAGLAAGDVLVSVDGAHPTSMGDARRRLAGRAGSDVVVEVTRGAKHESLRVPRETVRQ